MKLSKADQHTIFRFVNKYRNPHSTLSFNLDNVSKKQLIELLKSIVSNYKTNLTNPVGDKKECARAFTLICWNVLNKYDKEFDFQVKWNEQIILERNNNKPSKTNQNERSKNIKVQSAPFQTRIAATGRGHSISCRRSISTVGSRSFGNTTRFSFGETNKIVVDH